MKQIIGYFLIFVSIVIILYVVFLNTQPGKTNQTFSSYTFLQSTWEKYKTQYVNSDGRVIDYSQNSITTSEGESYGLLRAVWIDDKQTFDSVWNFTKNNLKRPSDNLFGWRWGKRSDNSYGFLSSSDSNSATDADEDIALALIFAYKRWNQQSYLDAAKKILPDIWNKDTAISNGKRYVIAGNWAQNQNQLVIDPSYFAPYEYRVFAKVDTKHDWESLIDPGYTFLTSVGTNNLDKGKGVGLPPDWVALNKNDGSLTQATIPNVTTNYGYDAVRVPFRIALDYLWNNDSRAKTYLQQSFSTLISYYDTNNKLASVYAHDGAVVTSTESPTMYATALGFFLVTDKSTADQIYKEKILGLYSNNTNSFNAKIPYYDQNWLWFGAALYNHALSNFD